MKALELADMIEQYNVGVMSQVICEDYLKAADELRRLAAVEAELERIKAMEPVAWRYKKEGGGWFVSDNEPQYVEQWNDIEEVQPLYALGSKT